MSVPSSTNLKMQLSIVVNPMCYRCKRQSADELHKEMAHDRLKAIHLTKYSSITCYQFGVNDNIPPLMLLHVVWCTLFSISEKFFFKTKVHLLL